MTHVVLVVVNLLDLVWTSRVNVAIGIPDYVFAFLSYDGGLRDLVKRFFTIPMYILAARVCPPSVMATAFALNMGLSNFGVRMGGYLGMALLALLGGVAPPAFVNMQWLILIRALCRLVPVLFIPLLIPKGSPRDDAFKIRGRDDGVKLAAEGGDPADGGGEGTPATPVPVCESDR